MVIDGLLSADVRLRPDVFQVPQFVEIILFKMLDVEVTLNPEFFEATKATEGTDIDVVLGVDEILGSEIFAVLALVVERPDTYAVPRVDVRFKPDDIFVLIPLSVPLERCAGFGMGVAGR